jgi:hypothetical protein
MPGLRAMPRTMARTKRDARSGSSTEALLDPAPARVAQAVHSGHEGEMRPTRPELERGTGGRLLQSWVPGGGHGEVHREELRSEGLPG